MSRNSVEANEEAQLERAWAQWQFGDWRSLANLPEGGAQSRSGASALKVLKSAGLLQLGSHPDSLAEAREILGRALGEEGASREQVVRTLIAGVHNCLGIASAVAGRGAYEVLNHLKESHRIGRPGSDMRFTLETSLRHQLSNLSMGPSQLALRGLELGLAELRSIAPGTFSGLTTTSKAKSHALFEMTFSIDGVRTKLAFFTDQPKAYRIAEHQLHFNFAGGTHNYLVSVESGSFNVSPELNYFSLQASASYELFGTLVGDFSDAAQIWVFQYSRTKKTQANQTRCNGGQFRLVFHSDPFALRGGVGIRLAGSGFVDLAASEFFLRSNSVAAIGSSVEAQVLALKTDVLVSLEKQQSRQAKQSLAQLESFVRLQTYMGRDLLLPEMHGWPISPDFGVLVIRLLEATNYDLVIEFGSGSSTVIVAEVLRRREHRTGRATAFISFEHLEGYRDKTAALLKDAGQETRVDLILAPLEDFSVDGEVYPYYDESIVGALINRLESKTVFVLVDGPPAATGPRARFPAFPLLSKHLPTSELHFLMDDYVREDEREIVVHWQRSATNTGYEVDTVEFADLEKQACLLKMRPIQSREGLGSA